MTSKRRWFTDEEYMQAMGFSQLMPGAPTVNLSCYLGFRLRGLPGAATATTAFLVPCFFLMLLLSHLYFQYGEMSVISGLFHGLGAVVVGLVLNTILNLWGAGIKTTFNALMALAGFAMVFWFKMGIVKILLVACGSSLAMVFLSHSFPAFARWTGSCKELSKNSITADTKPQRASTASKPGGIYAKVMDLLSCESNGALQTDVSDYASACSLAPLSVHWRRITFLGLWLSLILAVDLALIQLRPDLLRMGGSFLRIGALTFGSGYAMLPFIQNTVVSQFGWLTDRQFAAALALSLLTPGPVTIICVFIGYKAAGIVGAVAGMVNMYLPAWAMTTLAAAPYAKAGQSVHVRQLISGIVAAFIGTLFVVLIRLSIDTLVDFPAIAMAAGAFFAQRFIKVDTGWIVVGGALVSLAVFH
jgi:chromate transporter